MATEKYSWMSWQKLAAVKSIQRDKLMSECREAQRLCSYSPYLHQLDTT